VMGLSASLGQPLLGYLSDRYPRLCMVALGPAVAAIFSTLIGYAPGYHELLFLLFLAGLGIGAFHPQGASLARQAAGGRGLAMAAFTVGGNIGFGLAPLIGALGARLLGLDQFYWLAIPGLLYSLLLFKTFTTKTQRAQRGHEPHDLEPGDKERLTSQSASNVVPSSCSSCLRGLKNPSTVALGFLTATVMVRAAVQIGIVTFLPFYLPERGFAGMSPEAARGMAASVFLLANAVGGPLGGHLSDRLGGRAVMLGTFLLAPWPLFAAFHAPGYGCLAGLALGGFLLTMPHPANVVMAQELMPGRAGVAASMITGLAWGLAQILAFPLGGLADRIGVPLTLQILSLLPLLGIVLTLPVPERRG
jgi:MFS transporter, FSR family, fosmidomycin resistance protein